MLEKTSLWNRTGVRSRQPRKTKLLLSLLAAVSIVAALAVTGYVAPSAAAKIYPRASPLNQALNLGRQQQVQLFLQRADDFPGSDWQTATPQEVGMDPTLFAAAMNSLPSPAVVIRNGRIVGQKGDIARTGYVWSASKSLVALVFARALQQGQVANYDVAVPNSNVPGDPPATFRQFMSMTSDFNLTPHSPGNHYAYNNGAVHFYGTYLKNTFYPGRSEVQMLQEAYVSALGFQDGLSYNTAGYLSGWDGGWAMSTRDLARIGYLLLRDGNWNGQQILPASFINDLYVNQIPAAATEATGTDPFYNEYPATTRIPGAYSFGFWLPQRTVLFGAARHRPKLPACPAPLARACTFRAAKT